MTAHIEEAAPAKINLALHVTGRRPDGYHELDSIVCFAAPDGMGADRIGVRAAAADSLLVEGPFAAGVSVDASNFVWQARARFRETWPDALPGGVQIVLEKNLPPASGIGGGSADAAATLRALARMAGDAPDPRAIERMALELGADVPVCVRNVPARMRGIGELIDPVALPRFGLVLANPLAVLGTADVFRRLEKRDNDGLAGSPSAFASVDELSAWLSSTRNDLAAAAEELMPVIAALRADVSGSPDCRLARMSGSGATVFGLFDDAARAEAAAAGLRRKWPTAWVVATPAGGRSS